MRIVLLHESENKKQHITQHAHTHTHTHTHINTLNAYKKINQAENILCPSNIEEFSYLFI
jgi:hypothetical protein